MCFYFLKKTIFVLAFVFLFCFGCYAGGIDLNPDKVDRIVIKTNDYVRMSTGPSYPRYFADFYYADVWTKTVLKDKSEIKEICSMMSKFKEVDSSEYVHPQGKKPIKKCDYPYPFCDESVDCFVDKMYISLKMEIYSNNFRNIVVIWGDLSDVCFKNRLFRATSEFQNLIILYDDKNRKK